MKRRIIKFPRVWRWRVCVWRQLERELRKKDWARKRYIGGHILEGVKELSRLQRKI